MLREEQVIKHSALHTQVRQLCGLGIPMILIAPQMLERIAVMFHCDAFFCIASRETLQVQEGYFKSRSRTLAWRRDSVPIEIEKDALAAILSFRRDLRYGAVGQTDCAIHWTNGKARFSGAVILDSSTLGLLSILPIEKATFCKSTREALTSLLRLLHFCNEHAIEAVPPSYFIEDSWCESLLVNDSGNVILVPDDVRRAPEHATFTLSYLRSHVIEASKEAMRQRARRRVFVDTLIGRVGVDVCRMTAATACRPIFSVRATCLRLRPLCLINTLASMHVAPRLSDVALHIGLHGMDRDLLQAKFSLSSSAVTFHISRLYQLFHVHNREALIGELTRDRCHGGCNWPPHWNCLRAPAIGL